MEAEEKAVFHFPLLKRIVTISVLAIWSIAKAYHAPFNPNINLVINHEASIGLKNRVVAATIIAVVLVSPAPLNIPAVMNC